MENFLPMQSTRKPHTRTVRAALPIVAAACLTLLLSGCWHVNPRHGLILRGDWSFEVNRIPWMASHNDCYQEPMAPPCLGPGGGPGGGPEGCDATPCEARGCGPKACKLRPQGGCADAAQGDACVDYGNHPRFHPVPTKPVFSPRGPGLSGVPTSPPGNYCPVPGRFHGATIPEPEVIPAPKPKPSQGAAPAKPKATAPKPRTVPADSGTKPSEPKRLAKPTTQSAWIFTPPQDWDPETELANQRTRAARSALR